MPEFLARFRGRTDMIQYAKQHGIPIKASRSKPYSEDDNLLHISHEAGILEDPNAPCAEDVYSRTATIETAPNVADIISITFKDGIPVKVVSDAKTETDPLKLFMLLNDLGTKHGIGRLDMVENRFVGIKSRGVYETPGGTILLNAHRDIEGLVMDREVMKIRDVLSLKVAELIYNGFWFSPEFAFLMKCIDESQAGIDGIVRLKLLKGVAYPIARESDKALYDPKLSSMDEEGGYNQQDAEGFIKINAVRLRNWSRVAKK
jgi:argininosuccinate synthase